MIISGKQFKELESIAKKEFTKFKKRKCKEKQCSNTLRGCLVGIIGEEAAAMFITEQAGNGLERISQLGMKERTTPRYKARCDIACKVGDKHYAYEVKSINKGSVRGQITPYHLSKYASNKIDAVIFVEVTLFDEYAECEVYLHASPKEIKGWNKVNNMFGTCCYTHPSYEDDAFMVGKY